MLTSTAATAFEAHRRLVTVHPFNDGHGRTARLMVNPILMRAGYPRSRCVGVDWIMFGVYRSTRRIEGSALHLLLYGRLDATLTDHLSVLSSVGEAPSELS